MHGFVVFYVIVVLLFMMTSSNGNIFRCHWPFHRSPVNSPHRGRWRGALMFSLICVWINGWVNNREASDLRRYRAHYDVTVVGKRSRGVEVKTCCRAAPSHYLNLSSGRLCDTDLRALSWEDLKIPISKTKLKNAFLKAYPGPRSI